MKYLPFILLILISFGDNANARECFELGPQAGLSVHIDTKKRLSTLDFGEKKIQSKLKIHQTGGSLANYTFNLESSEYSLTILNEKVDGQDSRYLGVMTNLTSIERIFLACKL